MEGQKSLEAVDRTGALLGEPRELAVQLAPILFLDGGHVQHPPVAPFARGVAEQQA